VQVFKQFKCLGPWSMFLPFNFSICPPFHRTCSGPHLLSLMSYHCTCSGPHLLSLMSFLSYPCTCSGPHLLSLMSFLSYHCTCSGPHLLSLMSYPCTCSGPHLLSLMSFLSYPYPSPLQVGGLGDVVTALGRAVQDQGHLVEVILPK
jgi:hypothetical protein